MADIVTEAFAVTNQTDKVEVKEEEKTMMNTPENRKKIIDIIQQAWNTFHKYFVYILIAMAIGVYIGISASKIYFSNKIEDATKVEGMVFNGKIYSITPK